MAESIFISYRRSDSQHAAFAIADRLRWAFGAHEIFFDRGSIRSGNEWPESLRLGLESASVLIAVMGKAWMTTADSWGRRRIDDPDDWVRLELLSGLQQLSAGKLCLIPVLLEGAQRLRAEGLDAPLKKLADLEPKLLRDDSWETDLESLISSVASAAGLSRTQYGDRNPNGSPARPLKRQSKQVALSDAEVRVLLEQLPRWQLQWGPHPWGIAGQAQEITKSYDFDSFAEAIDFMTYASTKVETWRPPHHPRWENQWKVVNVWFSTWDVDCRLTKLDIEAARRLDGVFSSWRAERALSALDT